MFVDSKNLHLILASVAAPGHLNATLLLARHLARPRDNMPGMVITVTCLFDPAYEAKIVYPTQDNIRIWKRPAPPSRKAWLDDLEGNNRRYALAFAEDVKREIVWPVPAAVIFDFSSAFGQMLAQHLHVPSYCFSATSFYFMYSFIRVHEMSILAANEHTVLEVPGMCSLPIPSPPITEAEFAMENAMRTISDLAIDAYANCEGILVNDVEEFYPQVFKDNFANPPVPNSWVKYCCGPLAYADVRAQSHSFDNTTGVSEFMNRYPAKSILYIALGSYWRLEERDLAELVHGVALSNRPFVFAFRGSTSPDPLGAYNLKHCKSRVEFDEGGLPKGFRKLVQERSLIVPWVDQIQVLKHPSLGAFVTHCGWNSLTESIYFAGVPLLLLPLCGDQPAAAEFVESHLKCGYKLRDPDGILSRHEVAEKINRAMNDQTSQASAARETAILASRLDGSSERNTLSFLEHIRNKIR
eukprot:Gregarina_sp_Poly_1__2564@NODE_1696_length_3525_cov_61_762869_g517_i1_p1_GENE_NODE_1696_length_3525_cov_61_762869_g517_i1NODE_1696_length_3525_cov_61_762869_g517_i1_p1_ORF_typecomplete_len469_score42_20UDPGT/PF00201_18/2_8e36_NODE_1696_length_3525_cov_61_762869_g517_i117553161